jgi:hypothetical protein
MLIIISISSELDSNYPGVIFFNPPATQHLTSSATTIGQLEDIGVSVSVPEKSLGSSRKASDFGIYPCFSGPFELPDEYESASPAYLLRHDKVDFQKDLTIRMRHYACLEREEDCEDMVFLSASSTPENRESCPVYTFKEIHGAKRMFKAGDQVGEISLRHFCFTKIARKRHRKGVAAGKKHEGMPACSWNIFMLRKVLGSKSLFGNLAYKCLPIVRRWFCIASLSSLHACMLNGSSQHTAILGVCGHGGMLCTKRG